MKKFVSIKGSPLDPMKSAIPCGKYASFYPEGIFEIIDTSNNKSIEIKTN